MSDDKVLFDKGYAAGHRWIGQGVDGKKLRCLELLISKARRLDGLDGEFPYDGPAVYDHLHSKAVYGHKRLTWDDYLDFWQRLLGDGWKQYEYSAPFWKGFCQGAGGRLREARDVQESSPAWSTV
jgi:hypothetical protein